MPRVTRTDQAEWDIAEIDLRLSRLSSRYADKIMGELSRLIHRLALFPRSGQACPHLAPGLMKAATRGGYLVFYTPTDDGIEIQRVLHGARNIDPSLFDL